MQHTATYSPEDNKLRLYPAARLDEATYQRVKAHGFTWAPKQELFVAPAWTPEREDLLRELAGDIDDEDRTLLERAEERAERFEDYSEARQADAAAAHEAVKALADNIPLGQPILVGHHSEKRARKDAERIQNGMRAAVKAWETSQYWTERAAGAIAAAKYKERPDVRARRIRTIEAEARKVQRSRDESAHWLKLWTREGLTLEQARAVANGCWLNVARGEQEHQRWTAYDVLRPDGERYSSCPAWTVEQVQDVARRVYPRAIARAERWLAHLSNRLQYERAMLAADGGTVADRTKPEKGGAVRCWASRGGWLYVQKVNRISVTIHDNWGHGGRDFRRVIPFDKLAAIMSAADVEQARAAGRLQPMDTPRGFYLAAETPKTTETPKPAPAPAVDHHGPGAEEFRQMRESLRAGVQVVAAPQLFPTPPELAERMVRLAALPERGRVLEPSAGSGQLLGQILHQDRGHALEAVAVEINGRLVELLRAQQRAGAYPLASIRCADFLQCNGDLGKFDRIVMNPPFSQAEDIEHIEHALGMLKPGGRLVALCANGPRQRARLLPLVEKAGGTWEDLPGAFKEQGTAVNCALLVIDAPAEAPAAARAEHEPEQASLL